jgi:hypothetical protein
MERPWVAEKDAVYWIEVQAPVCTGSISRYGRSDQQWRVSSDISAFALVQHKVQPYWPFGSDCSCRTRDS